MTEEKIASFLVAINLFMLTYYLYPKQIKKIAPFIISSLVVLIFVGLILKSGANESEHFLMHMSEILASYFSGPANVAVALDINEQFNVNIIFSDIVNSIPFAGYFFKELVTTPKIFNYTLYGESGRFDQIIPMIGQGYSYFGLALSPIFSCICVKLSVKFENLNRRTTNLLSKYIFTFTSVIFAISPILYNFNILISWVSNIIIITLLVKLTDSQKLCKNNGD